MAEASVREERLLAGPRAKAEFSVSVGALCGVLRVSPKLGLVMAKEERRDN